MLKLLTSELHYAVRQSWYYLKKFTSRDNLLRFGMYSKAHNHCW